MSLRNLATTTAITLALAAAPGPTAAQGTVGSAFGDQVPSGFGQVAIFGLESARLGGGTRVVSGDVVVNDAAEPGAGALTLGPQSSTPSGFTVRADQVVLDAGATVAGELLSNRVEAASGALTTPDGRLSLPVFASLPPFRTAAPGAGARDVVVPRGRTVVVAPGRYLVLRIGLGGRAILTGGVYHFLTVEGRPRSSLVFAAPSDVRIAERLMLGAGSFLGPSSASPAHASWGLLYVGGREEGPSSPPTVRIGARSKVGATLYAPGGTVVLGAHSQAAGALVGRRVVVRNGSLVSLASGLREEPPPSAPTVAADPQSVETQGGEQIEIILTGTDREGGDLDFGLATLPTEGKILSLDPIVPKPVFDPNRGGTVQPPVTSARAVYAPNGPDNLWDTFLFKVADRDGNIAQAEVTINSPGGDELMPAATADALDVGFLTFRDTPVSVVLEGNAPDKVDLSFDIVNPPTFGDLGRLVPGREVPQRTATIDYLPPKGFLGVDNFVYVACGTVAGKQVCDKATATVEMQPDPTTFLQPAYNFGLATLRDTAVEIDLQGTPRKGEEPVAFTVVALPKSGDLTDSRGNLIRDVPFPLPDNTMFYRPAKGFSGQDQIAYEGNDGVGPVQAQVLVDVLFGSCDISLAFCDDGR